MSRGTDLQRREEVGRLRMAMGSRMRFYGLELRGEDAADRLVNSRTV
jgi:hypothetical protein